jgi:hypothetical protein
MKFHGFLLRLILKPLIYRIRLGSPNTFFYGKEEDHK